MSKDYLTAKDLQEMFGISEPTAYRILHNPTCPRVRIGRLWYTPRDRFEQWVRDQGEHGVGLTDYGRRANRKGVKV